MKFSRSFSADVGQHSTGAAGPDQIEHDLDQIAINLDPLQSGGGIDTENLCDDAITDAIVGDRVVDPAIATAYSLSGTLTEHLSWIAKNILAMKGTATNWYDAGAATIETLWGKFHATTGHGHTGSTNDAPQIGTTGIADSAVTASKIGANAVTDAKIGGRSVNGTLGTTNWIVTFLNLTGMLQDIYDRLIAITGVIPTVDTPITLNALLGKFHTSTGHKHTGATGDSPPIATTGIADDAVTDAKVGNRTLNNSSITRQASLTLTQALNSLAGQLLAAYGAGIANWYDAIPLSLTQVYTSLLNHTHAGLDSPQITATGIASDAVTDVKIGNRTLNNASVTRQASLTLTQALNSLAGQIYAIYGAGVSNWYDTIPVNLTQVYSGLLNHTHNGTDSANIAICHAENKTPASATATGVKGEVCWDINYVYVCVATNTWKRSAISTW